MSTGRYRIYGLYSGTPESFWSDNIAATVNTDTGHTLTDTVCAVDRAKGVQAASTTEPGIIQIGTTAGTALDGGTTIVDATARAIINGVVGYQVKAMSVTNLTLSGAQTIDGVSCVAGDVVGALGQNDLTTAGPWVVGASGWTRPAWFPAAAHAFGVKLTVQYGSTYGGTQWTCITAASDIIGTDKLVWSGNQAVLPSQVDGSTLYLWQCAEPGGSVLYDSGPQAAHITLAGTANTDWVRARASTPKQYQLHNLDPSGIHPAVFHLPVAVPGASSFTVEMTLNMDATPRGNQMCLFLSNSQTGGCDAVGSFDFGGVWYCGAGYGGGFANGSTTTTIRGTACHLGLTWTDGAGLDFFINGQHVGSRLAYASPLAAMNWIAIGGDTRSSGGLDSMRGYISNCRISSVVRDLAWMQRQYQYALWG